jgi:hypothetical protein
VPRSLPPGLDDSLAELALVPAAHEEAYRRITSHLDESLHFAPPRAFGEVGWLVKAEQ